VEDKLGSLELQQVSAVRTDSYISRVPPLISITNLIVSCAGCALMTRDFAVACQPTTPTTEQEHRNQICRVGRWMYSRGHVVANEGNLSVRLDEHRILVTPSGKCKGRLAVEDLLVTDLSGEVVYGAGRPSSEMQMHLLYYRSRPDVLAICHGHPPTATGFAAAGRALEEPVLPEVIVGLGKIPLASYGTPGTWELCAGLEPFVHNYDAILLENHGVVTCGPDLGTAYQRLETVEQFARVMLTAELLGGPHLLPRAEVQKLAAGRPHRGISRPFENFEVPLTAEAARERGALAQQSLEPVVK
jgi:L-fuculose-phosphate aldolase